MTANQIKQYAKLKQKKHRDSERKFLIEGIHLLAECLNSKIYSKRIEKIIVSSDFDDDKLLKFFSEILKDVEIAVIEDKKFNLLTETVNSQGILAVLKMPDDLILPDDTESRVIVALDKINDPGNLGTILRTCYWFNVDEVIISKGSADIFNSKTLRATQGAVFHLNIRTETDLQEQLSYLNSKGYRIVLTDLSADKTFSENDNEQTGKIVITFGNEAGGISHSILSNENFERMKIKSYSKCESLNVAVAAGIVLDRLASR